MNVILSIHPKWAKLIYEGKKTIEALRKAAKEHPDYGLKDLLKITPTHYCHIDSAASAISSWASKGIIEKFWK